MIVHKWATTGLKTYVRHKAFLAPPPPKIITVYMYIFLRGKINVIFATTWDAWEVSKIGCQNMKVGHLLKLLTMAYGR